MVEFSDFRSFRSVSVELICLFFLFTGTPCQGVFSQCQVSYPSDSPQRAVCFRKSKQKKKNNMAGIDMIFQVPTREFGLS